MSSTDTIYALATAPAKSGVAVVRLSGRRAHPAASQLSGRAAFMPRVAQLVSLNASDGTLIDQGLAIFFPAPHSFTGEDVVELQVHGSLAVIQELVRELSLMPGLRLAEPGEFCRRAFLNGKMDLLAAEGLADLIDAETSIQKSQSQRQLLGELSHYYGTLREQMLLALAHLEAYIDFPDEDIPEAVYRGVFDEISALAGIIRQALADQGRGERVRDGLSVVIIGPPNAGKSSLMNALAARDVAIVSAVPGTTRDLIEVHLDIGGYPVVIVDTAGIREAEDAVESEGIRRAQARAATADITLLVLEASMEASLSLWTAHVTDTTLIIFNKSDQGLPSALPNGALVVSVRTGEGMADMLKALELKVSSLMTGDSAPMITRVRHRELLEKSLKCLEESLNGLPLELMCEELRQAALALGKITGVIQVDDVLDKIFSSFCIGK